MSSLAVYQTPHLPDVGLLCIVVASGEYDETNAGKWYYGEYVILRPGSTDAPLYSRLTISDSKYEAFTSDENVQVVFIAEAVRAALRRVEEGEEYGKALDQWSEDFRSTWREHVRQLQDGVAYLCGLKLRDRISRDHFQAIGENVKHPELAALAQGIGRGTERFGGGAHARIDAD